MSKIRYKDKPIGFLVVIRQEEVPKTSEAGIELFHLEGEWEYEQFQHGIGTVEAIGSTAFHHPKYGFDPSNPEAFECPIQVGDLVRFKAQSAHGYREERTGNWDKDGGFMVYVNDAHVLGICEREEVEDENEVQYQSTEGGIVIPVGGANA